MRIGLGINYAGGFKEVAAEVADLERAGLDIVFVPEAYSFDAVSALGYLAASTQRVQLASGILQLYTRSPTLIAMTAAGLDYVSDGRFTLGLGASGPQVIEGFHGVPYDAPIARTREVIDICRQVWRREYLQYQGKYYTIPLPPARARAWANRSNSSISLSGSASRSWWPRWDPRMSSWQPRSPRAGNRSSICPRRLRTCGERPWPPAGPGGTPIWVSSTCLPARYWRSAKTSSR